MKHDKKMRYFFRCLWKWYSSAARYQHNQLCHSRITIRKP